jgi:pre-mRNA-processing factor 17
MHTITSTAVHPSG